MAAPTFVAASLLLFLIGAAALTAAGTGSAAAATSAPHVDATSSWTVYHGDPLGTGVDTSGVTFNPPNPAWTSPVLDGQVYGEPLEVTGRVYVATENDTVYALAANTGAVLWSTHVGTPVPSGDLPCGDIGPQVGITGTPVIDASSWRDLRRRRRAGRRRAGPLPRGLQHVQRDRRPGRGRRPAGTGPAAILQRTGLNLERAATSSSAIGGNDGDCSPYQRLGRRRCPRAAGRRATTKPVPIPQRRAPCGWAAPRPRSMRRATSGRRPGTGRRRLRTTAATRSCELSPGLARTQLLRPEQLGDRQRERLGPRSCSPALLSNGTILQAGKSSTAYLLSQASLGGIGGQIGSPISACGSDADGGDAISGTVVYVPCGNGVQGDSDQPCSARSGRPRPGRTALRSPPAGSSGQSVGRRSTASTRRTGPRCNRSRSAARPTTSRPRRSATAAPGTVDRSGLRLLGLGRAPRPALARRRRRRRTRRTGWSHPTAGSSPSATQASTARPAACH